MLGRRRARAGEGGSCPVELFLDSLELFLGAHPDGAFEPALRGQRVPAAEEVARVFHFYAGAVDKHGGSEIPVSGGVDVTFREPLGVVGLIVPW